MFPSKILQAARSSEPPAFDFDRNPYKAKRVWPPDFSRLSERHQFRFERRYRRRTKLKWARPRLMVATKLAQWGGCISVATYCILFMDWGDDQAFKGIRDWYKSTVDSILYPRNQSRRRPIAQEESKPAP